MDKWGEILNKILFRRFRINRLGRKLNAHVDGEITGDLLCVLLNAMGLAFLLDPEFAKNIHGFEAEYAFTDKKSDFYRSAHFHNGKLTVSKKEIQNPDFLLIFKDEESLIKFLFSGSPDILNAMLNQEISFEGNINYINKFAYMALHLLHNFSGGSGYGSSSATHI